MSSESFVDQEVNFIRLENAKHEDEFMTESVNLSNEIIINTFLLVGINEDPSITTMALDRKDAIVYGLMLRSIKLFQSYMELICKRRGEAAKILLRSVLETIVNVQYLIIKDSQELFDEYIKYSLITEKKVLSTLQRNAEERGEKIPIEGRMIKSILNSFIESGCSIDEIQLDPKKNKWGRITLREKLNEFYSKESYDLLFGETHHSVHGNWQSLLFEDLRYNSEAQSYELMFKHSNPRPQHVLSAIMLLCGTAEYFIEYSLSIENIKHYALETFRNTFAKAERIDRLHEEFLIRGKK